MDAPTLEFATMEELAPLLAKKKISPVELVQLYLARIEHFNPTINAFLTVTGALALQDARRAERELLRGHRRGLLHGIPVALKDNIYMSGIRATAGSAILRDFVPAEDATIVRRLRRAGAVVLGKTNMHEFAYGISSENPHFGAVRNPWALERISGGSSGGSAAAVAAGLCVASIGTDTGGSIRVPSSLCGVVGLKPTFGRISVHGVLPLAPSFDHVGAIARSTHDTAALLNVLAGRDPLDPASVSKAHGDFVVGLRKKPRKMRLGRPREHYWTQLDPEVKRLCEAAVASLLKLGATIEEVSLPSLPSAVDAANIVALVEATEVHTRAGWFPASSAQYGADVAARLEQGREVRALEYLRAREILHRSRAEFDAALARVDVLIAPTTAIPAPAIGAETVRMGNEEESVRSALVRLNRPANFTGLPAISVPCGFTKAGLPVGLQLIGRSMGEGAILAIARSYEQAHDWQAEHPPLS